jgi:hypothetical protein
MTSTITLKDGRVVLTVHSRAEPRSVRWEAFVLDDWGELERATGPTEAAAIEALRQKLEDDHG